MNETNPYYRIVKYSGAFLIIFSSSVILAWMAKFQIQISAIPGLPPMRLDNAINFLFVGLSMLFIFDSKRTSLLFAFLTMLVSIYSLIDDLVNTAPLSDKISMIYKDVNNSFSPISISLALSVSYP